MSSEGEDRWWPDDAIDAGTLRMSITGMGLLALPPIALIKLSHGVLMIVLVLVIETIIWGYWWHRWGRRMYLRLSWRHRRRARRARRGP